MLPLIFLEIIEKTDPHFKNLQFMTTLVFILSKSLFSY